MLSVISTDKMILFMLRMLQNSRGSTRFKASVYMLCTLQKSVSVNHVQKFSISVLYTIDGCVFPPQSLIIYIMYSIGYWDRVLYT